MKYLLSFIAIAILVLAAGASPAQDDYIVGEKDVLVIHVWDEPEMTTTVVVSSQGTVTYWMLGEIEVAGKSVKEIKDYLTRTLAENYLKNPVVDVRVEEFKSKEINIQGAVRSPGTYILDTNSISLLKLISKAGGTVDEVGSQAYILRGAANRLDETAGETEIAKMEDKIVIDLFGLIRRGDLSQDKPIFGGDFIFVTSKTIENVNINYIWVEGEVKNPGKIDYQEGLTALQACIQVEGFTMYAAPKRTKISRIRGDGTIEIIKVNLKAIRKGKKPDVLLQPGDRITVPQRFF